MAGYVAPPCSSHPACNFPMCLEAQAFPLVCLSKRAEESKILACQYVCTSHCAYEFRLESFNWKNHQTWKLASSSILHQSLESMLGIFYKICPCIMSFMMSLFALDWCTKIYLPFSHLCFLPTGGPYGHSDEVRARANDVISLSTLVLNHQVGGEKWDLPVVAWDSCLR